MFIIYVWYMIDMNKFIKCQRDNIGKFCDDNWLSNFEEFDQWTINFGIYWWLAEVASASEAFEDEDIGASALIIANCSDKILRVIDTRPINLAKDKICDLFSLEYEEILPIIDDWLPPQAIILGDYSDFISYILANFPEQNTNMLIITDKAPIWSYNPN